MKVSVLGATGTMGGLVVKALLQEGGFAITGKVSRRDNVEVMFGCSDIIIDFSCPLATEAMLRYAASSKSYIPIVIGTTGLSKVHHELMNECATHAPVFCSPNMSPLVAMLNFTVHLLAKIMDEDYDVEIFESHHRMKKDAPSGTALMLGRTIARARNREFDDVANFMRYGIIEQRKRGEIGFSVQRSGMVVGTHEVAFIGSNESLKIRHEAYSKEIFAKGAVKVAKWLVRQDNGIYSMDDLARDTISPLINEWYGEFFGSERQNKL
ncbi:MAG: 4-hydroxy-tetrahydrodipicolinate reductase [Holosporales bacterium]|jgi:4-hydroxy-tetrahydrodipicolinate reductase|nr:4-hydroxy-tetrahydrodipicolinate reductase [Holosporales bacterium]